MILAKRIKLFITALLRGNWILILKRGDSLEVEGDTDEDKFIGFMQQVKGWTDTMDRDDLILWKAHEQAKEEEV